MKVLVTGGSGGIGKSIVNLFTNKGLGVYAPNKNELNLLNEINLENRDFDIIVNCAGINPLNNLLDSNNSDVMKINYFSPLEIVKQCLPNMIKNNYGRIINIGSIWINIAKPKRLDYSVSKNALHTLTKFLTAEYASYNILSNTISPGFIETQLTFKNNTNEEIIKIKNNIPVKRLGQPEEIANLVYQMTVENEYICGQNIIIDGGYSCVVH